MNIDPRTLRWKGYSGNVWDGVQFECKSSTNYTWWLTPNEPEIDPKPILTPRTEFDPPV